MKNLILLFFILASAISLQGQKPVLHSDSAFTVAPIPEFEKHIYRDPVRQWLDTTFFKILDSLNIKTDYGYRSNGVHLELFSKNKILKTDFLDDVKEAGASCEICDDTLLFGCSAPINGLRFLAIYMQSPIPVNNFNTGITIHNHKESQYIRNTIWFSKSKKEKYIDEISFGLKDYKLQFDTFPPYCDTLAYFRGESIEIKGKLSFTTDIVYIHKKPKKAKPCYIKGTLYFSIYRYIRNSNIGYRDDTHEKYFINPDKK